MMKNIHKIKVILVQMILISAFTFTISSCKKKEKTEDSKEVATEKNEAKIHEPEIKAGAEFLVFAAESDQEEIGLGKLAEEKAYLADVKELGKKMIEGHTKSSDKIIALAKMKSFSLPDTPTDEVKENYKMMSEMKSNKKFDEAYCQKMINAHKIAISKFEKIANEGVDVDIKMLATEILPDLRKHLEMAETCQKKFDSMK